MLLDALAVGCAPTLPPVDGGLAADATAPPDVDRDGMTNDVVDGSATDVAMMVADIASRDVRFDDAPAADAPTSDTGSLASDTGSLASDTGPLASDAGMATPDAGAGGPRDASSADVTCTGSGPVVTVSAPASEQVIETCSASDAPVYFDFVANVSSSVPIVSVGARWITPDGAEAPPPATVFASPYTFRRQVGGPSGAAPALAVFGIRGGWRVQFTALDVCGRRGDATRSFSLTFTSRRCPNP